MHNSTTNPKTRNFSNCKVVEYSEFIPAVTEALTGVELIKTNKKLEYINAPSAFDIESTSF